MASGLNFDIKDLANGLDIFGTKFDAAVKLYAETSALKLQSDAQKNAKWTDRTGHARQRLKGDSLVVSNGYKLRLAHGVEYGVYLEFSFAKRFAIIFPTLIHTGQEQVLPGFKNLIERIKM